MCLTGFSCRNVSYKFCSRSCGILVHPSTQDFIPIKKIINNYITMLIIFSRNNSSRKSIYIKGYWL